MDAVVKTETKNTDIVNIDPSLPVNATNLDKVKAELKIMIEYAVKRGKEIPSKFPISEEEDVDTLISNYNTMQKIIQPATTQSIRYITQEMKDKGVGDWFKIPIFTKCMIIAILSLVILIGVSLLPIVNEENQSQTLLSSSGLPLFVNLIFVCSASLLGVMFYLLKTVGDKIKKYTLLPVDAIEINASILIGVISGFVITELFTIAIFTGGDIEIQKMTMAMLGGFSSDAIFSLLQSLVNRFKINQTPAGV